jgi:hypothetical protein
MDIPSYSELSVRKFLWVPRPSKPIEWRIDCCWRKKKYRFFTESLANGSSVGGNDVEGLQLASSPLLFLLLTRTSFTLGNKTVKQLDASCTSPGCYKKGSCAMGPGLLLPYILVKYENPLGCYCWEMNRMSVNNIKGAENSGFNDLLMLEQLSEKPTG